MASDIVIPSEWEAVLRALRDRGSGMVYVVGAADRGKTTFCRWLTGRLANVALAGFLDCDIGQSTLGPPAIASINSGEHFLPLLYALAVRRDGDQVRFFNDDVFAALSMTSVVIGG